MIDSGNCALYKGQHWCCIILIYRATTNILTYATHMIMMQVRLAVKQMLVVCIQLEDIGLCQKIPLSIVALHAGWTIPMGEASMCILENVSSLKHYLNVKVLTLYIIPEAYLFYLYCCNFRLLVINSELKNDCLVT